MNRRTFTDLQILIHSYVTLRVICEKHSFFICKISNINNSMYNWFTLKHLNLSVSSLEKYFARIKLFEFICGFWQYIIWSLLWFDDTDEAFTLNDLKIFLYFQRQTFLKLKNTVNSFYNICIKTWLILWYKLLNRHIL